MIRTRSVRAGLPARARPRASSEKIAMPTSSAAASRPRGHGCQRWWVSLAVPPPAGELAAARAAVDDLDRGGGHALGGGAAGGLAQLPGPADQPGHPAMRGGQPLHGAPFAEVTVVALADQADP